jgi:uncharacterized small protein (DUF1192 family)
MEKGEKIDSGTLSRLLEHKCRELALEKQILLHKVAELEKQISRKDTDIEQLKGELVAKEDWRATLLSYNAAANTEVECLRRENESLKNMIQEEGRKRDRDTQYKIEKDEVKKKLRWCYRSLRDVSTKGRQDIDESLKTLENLCK